MAAELALVRGVDLSDHPWRRLGWILPSASLAWLLLLWALGFLLERQPLPPAPVPIDATLVELPPPEARRPETPSHPVPPQAVQPEPAKSVVEPEPLPVPSPVVVANPQPPAPSPAAPLRNPLESRRAAARVLYQPLPKIPDDLRNEAIEMKALARFDIKPDGTSTVELVRPTPNPALNRIILDTLKTWRFFPALNAGKPVASTQDLVIDLEVH